LRDLVSFTSNDVDDLARKLEQLLALKPSAHNSLSDAVRRAAVKHWSWERTAATILNELD